MISLFMVLKILVAIVKHANCSGIEEAMRIKIPKKDNHYSSICLAK